MRAKPSKLLKLKLFELSKNRSKKATLKEMIIQVVGTKPKPLRLSKKFLIVAIDRKSTRLNSSHTVISYAVFCLKKKKKQKIKQMTKNPLNNTKTQCDQST